MPDHDGLVVGADGKARCSWAGSAPEYLDYHDSEWGRELRGDQAMFERLSLEAFQSGLSWITILRKREAFRAEPEATRPIRVELGLPGGDIRTANEGRVVVFAQQVPTHDISCDRLRVRTAVPEHLDVPAYGV